MKKIWPKNIDMPILVDDEDYDRLNQYNWFISKQGYAVRNVKVGDKWTRYSMHREILQVDKGMDVEHKDQNRLNNQKSNLRASTRSQNMANVRKIKSLTSHSKYKGVSRIKRKNLKNQWLAYIRKDYKTHYLGYFFTEAEAARAYNAKAPELFGEFASLNEVPEDDIEGENNTALVL